MNQDEREKYIDIRKYYGSSIFALLIWSTSFICTKIAYDSFPPITLGALRFVIASAVLVTVLIIRKEFIKPSVKDLGIISFSGILGITLYFTLQNIGVSLTTASNAALIVSSYPAITALLELIIYRIKISKFKMFGISLAMVGIYLLSYMGSITDSRNQFVGNIILVATGIVWSFYNFMTHKVVNRYPAVTISCYQTIAGMICFIPLTFMERSNWKVPAITSLAMLIYLGVMCSVVAFMLYNFGLRKLSPGTSVSLMNLVPIFGVLFSVLFLHESISVLQLIGGVIVIAGVLLSTRQVKSKQIYPGNRINRYEHD